MKQTIILTALLAIVLCYSVKPEINGDAEIDPYIFEDLINGTIEGLRPNIPDPITFDTYEISLPEEDGAVVVGNASISNLNLAGLKGFQLTALNFEIIGLQLNFTIEVPVIDLFTDYVLNLLIADTVALYGDGNITVHLDGLAIEGSAQANLTGGIQVENLRIAVQLQNATFELHGLLNDEDVSELLADILNDLAVKLIDENQELVTEILSPLIEGLINSILAGSDQTTTAPPLDFTVELK